MKVLLVGATGTLGGTVAKELSGQAISFRCLVRKTADTTHLRKQGAELAHGYVRDNAVLAEAPVTLPRRRKYSTYPLAISGII